MARSTKPNEAFLQKRKKAGADDVYGRHWWLNSAVPAVGAAPPWPSAPADLFAARGHWGQSILVIPSRDVVIVRFADDREAGAFNLDTFIPLALAVADAADGAGAEEIR
jgi:CubicO group peptidase (beta-lactamase class C family)